MKSNTTPRDASRTSSNKPGSNSNRKEERSRSAPLSPASGVPQIIYDLKRLPKGSHCLDLYASLDEAAEHAAAFLEGADNPRAATYWVADDQLLAFHRDKTQSQDPSGALPFRALKGPQVVPQGGKLRPTAEVVRLVSSHPEGVTAGAATITRYWSREQIPAYLEYEQWFHQQARERSRFLCPYDLREVPVDMAPAVLPELARQHSHVILSRAPNPMALLVQLLMFPTSDAVPPEHREELSWATAEGLLSVDGRTHRLHLASRGEAFALALKSFSTRVSEASAGT